jgi:hypothetical protein
MSGSQHKRNSDKKKTTTPHSVGSSDLSVDRRQLATERRGFPVMFDSPPTRIASLNRGFPELLPRALRSREQRWWHWRRFLH